MLSSRRIIPSLFHKKISLINGTTIRSIHVEEKIAQLGLLLPPPQEKKGAFVHFAVIKNIAYISGHFPQPAEGPLHIGKIGKDLTTEQGYESAKVTGLNIMATLKHNIGNLDKIKRIIKLTGYINCIDNFNQHPSVLNGCSDLMNKILGEKGQHVRSALGVNSLPLSVPIEIEAIIELENNWNDDKQSVNNEILVKEKE